MIEMYSSSVGLKFNIENGKRSVEKAELRVNDYSDRSALNELKQSFNERTDLKNKHNREWTILYRAMYDDMERVLRRWRRRRYVEAPLPRYR